MKLQGMQLEVFGFLYVFQQFFFFLNSCILSAFYAL